MIIEKTKNFCISKIEMCGRCFFFINELRNGKPTGRAAEKAGKYYNTLEEAQKRLEERQKNFDARFDRLK